MDTLSRFLETQMEFLGDFLRLAAVPLLSAATVACLLAGVFFIVWFGMTYGLRRQERARCFFALLETGLKQGQSPEQTVVSLSRQRVREMGRGLHLVAARVESGMRLGPALADVPSFLPPQSRAMLLAGELAGNVGRALAACRETLRDAASGSLVATNNLMTLLFVSPAGPALVWVCGVWVVPKLKQIMADMLPGMTASPAVRLFEWGAIVANLTLVLWLVYWVMICAQHGGPWLRRWLDPLLADARERLDFWLPWRWRRMQRDFSVMLALALDSGVPEPKAVTLAGQATGNRRFAARAARVVAELERGATLTDAVAAVDGSGEFTWRLRNAAAGKGERGGFAAALAGWHESLAARAFQQEQAASQALTTGFVFLNALMVGLMAAGLFGMLIEIIQTIE